MDFEWWLNLQGVLLDALTAVWIFESRKVSPDRPEAEREEHQLGREEAPGEQL